MLSFTSPRTTPLLALLLLVLDGAAQNILQGNDCTPAGAYQLCQNLWGADTGRGSQTSRLISADGNAVSWQTNYTWSLSPDNVKSYPNMYHNTAKGMQLQDIVSAPTTWQWDYQSASNDLRADVSYDIWFGVPQSGPVASAASSYEIMIWLSNRGGVGGIGNDIVQNLRLGGHTWTLKYGTNSNWGVFSFITAEGDITDFSADLNDFFRYLTSQQGVAQTQFVQAIQAGTEPFTGSASLVTTSFTVDVSTTEDDSAPPTSSSSTRTETSSRSSSSSGVGSSTATTSSSQSRTGTEATSDRSPTSTDSDPAPSPTGSSTTGTGAAGTKCRLRRRTSSPAGLSRRHFLGTIFR